MKTENACTWVGCRVTTGTEAQLENGRAWAHLCSEHRRQYDAELRAFRAAGMFELSQAKHRELTYRAAGGEEAWKRFLFGPFAKGREKPRVLIGTSDEPAA